MYNRTRSCNDAKSDRTYEADVVKLMSTTSSVVAQWLFIVEEESSSKVFDLWHIVLLN